MKKKTQKKKNNKELFDPLKGKDMPIFDPLRRGNSNKPTPPQKRNKNRNKKGSVCRTTSLKLTRAESEVLGLFNSEFLTVSQVSARRGTSKTYIRKITRKLEKLGLMSRFVPPPQKTGGDPGTTGTKIGTKSEKQDKRIHAQKFRIELIKPISKKYLKSHVKKVTWIDNNNIQCFQKVICIQSEGKGFHGSTEEMALDVSMVYWYKFFRILENDLNCKILKDRRQNITMTYLEWATEDCDLSRECEKKGEPIKIFSMDGKLRYTTDKSFKYEREAHHHLTGKEDSETGNRFIEDVLDHPEAPKYSEIVKAIKLLAEQTRKAQGENLETARGLRAVVELIKLQSPSQEKGTKTKGKLPKADYIG